MAIILSDAKTNIYKSINESNTIRSLFGNPLVLSLIIVLLVLCIFTVQIYSVGYDNLCFIKQTKIIIYIYIISLICLCINNSIILYDCNKAKKLGRNEIFTGFGEIQNPTIISSSGNNIGSGVMSLQPIDKLDVDELLQSI